MTTFQRTVNTFPAPAVEGDFASANPRFTMLAGEDEFTAGPLGVVVGRFAWANPITGRVSNAHPGVANSRLGFVGRSQPVLITGWLESEGMTVQSGLEITMFSAADVWARFAAGATFGQKVFARFTDGAAIAGAAGATIAGASFTGVIAVTTGVLTASAVTGTIAVGAPIAGAGVPAGTFVTGQLTGAAGGAGTYSTNIITAVASVSMTTAGAVETPWSVQSIAAATELAKISA